MGSNFAREFEFLHVRKLFGYLTVRRWFYSGLFVPEIMHAGAPEGFLDQ
jgi:hypothetical protein